MSDKYDFKKEWPKMKKKLMEMSKEAMVLAKKGEEELVKFSHQSKRHIDVTALSLKKEKLFYQIGKEYIKGKKSKKESPKMAKLLIELDKVEKDERALKRQIKSKVERKS